MHQTYDHVVTQHTEETTTPSGLIISRHIGLISIGMQKAHQVGELFIASKAPEIDTSGFLHNPTNSFDTQTMEEAVEPIAGKVVELGTVASVGMVFFPPDNNPERVSKADRELIGKFNAVLMLAIAKKSAKEPSEALSIGDYL